MNEIRLNIPVFWIDFSYHLETKQKTLSILDKTKLSTSDKSDEKLIETDWYSEQGKRKDYWNYLEPLLFENIAPVLKKVYIESFEITNYWYNSYDNTGFRDWHRHPGSNWACIYFLHMPDNKHSTVIKDFDNNILQFDVKEGQILIFPSLFFHASPISNSEKKIIAFNIL